MNAESRQYSWNNLSPEIRAKIEEKKEYERRLGVLLEDIRTASLGIDYQTKVHFKQIEKRVINKLRQTQAEIEEIVRSSTGIHEGQGKLF